MSERKITVIVDGMFAPTEEEKAQVLKNYEVFKEHGATVQIVQDSSFLRDLPEENKIQEATHRVETQGPKGFVYDRELLDAVKGSEVIITHYNAVNEKLMDACGDSLKMIGIMRSGVETVDFNAAKERNVIVCNSPGRVSSPVADFAVGLMIAFERKISYFDMAHSKHYDPEEDSAWPPLMSDLTVGIVGFGIIGKKVAERLKPFGSKVIAYDPFVSQEAADEYGVKMVELNELMKESDIVTVHARMMEVTRNMIGKDQISLMKPNALFVNTARAGLVDEDALVDALKNHRIKGAALDVFREEPLPENSPFYELDNVLITPHRAGSAGSFVNLTTAAMKEEVVRYLDNQPLKYMVKK